MTDPTPGAPVAGAPDPDFVGDGEERRVDRAFVRVTRIRWWIRSAVVAVVLTLGVLFLLASAPPRAIAVGGAVLALGLLVLHLWAALRVPELAWERTRYRADPRGIVIRSGIWWRSVHHVPTSRIQHTDVTQGPIERRFGLGTLVVHTAGTHEASVSLPGLRYDRALRLRDFLVGEEGDD